MKNNGSNRLAVLAAEIQEADGRFRRSAEQAAAAAVEAGHRLIEAKALLPHGGWLPWLRDHAAISERSARRYMQLARSGLEIGHVADLGIAGATAAVSRRGGKKHDYADIEDAAVLWFAMLARYAALPAAKRKERRMLDVDAIASADGAAPMMQVYLRQTKENQLSVRCLW